MELTEPSSRSRLDDEGDVRWRGHDYFDAIRPLLPKSFPVGDGVSDSQSCWVAYVPTTDEFLIGFDLWLEAPNDDDDPPMAGGITRVRLTDHEGTLEVTTLGSERLSASIYEAGTTEQIAARFPPFVEIDVD